jgi:hypothetical protein
VCVPDSWTDGEIVAFTESVNPCGTTSGWIIRKDPENDPERNPCEQGRQGYVHVTLDA